MPKALHERIIIIIIIIMMLLLLLLLLLLDMWTWGAAIAIVCAHLWLTWSGRGSGMVLLWGGTERQWSHESLSLGSK
jgi:hypothetical protein